MWHNELFWQKQTETEWWDGSQQGVCGSKTVLLIWDQPTTRSFRQKEIDSDRERKAFVKSVHFLQWLSSLLSASFVRCQCDLQHILKPDIITLPLFWLLNDSIKHLYETVCKWLVLIEVSSPLQNMWAVQRGSTLGTRTWSAPSKWQIKPQKPILSVIFSNKIHAGKFVQTVIIQL